MRGGREERGTVPLPVDVERGPCHHLYENAVVLFWSGEGRLKISETKTKGIDVRDQ
jgi:hypothetical protein